MSTKPEVVESAVKDRLGKELDKASTAGKPKEEGHDILSILEGNVAMAATHVAALKSNSTSVLVVDVFGLSSEEHLDRTYGSSRAHFSTNSFEEICRALRDNKSVNSASFIHMLQGWNRGCKQLIEVVRHNATLKNLLLFGVHISPEEAKSLSEALASNKVLTELELQICRLNYEAMELLLAVFVKNTSVVKLEISGDKVYIKGKLAQTLQNVLTHNKTLTALDLSKNAMTNEGVDCITKGLKTNKTLRTLNLRECGITDYQAILIAETLPHIGLRSLDLSKNVFCETALRVLEACLSENSSLTELVLDYPKKPDGTLEPDIQAIQQKIQVKLAANAKLLEKPRLDLAAEQKMANERLAQYLETLKLAESMESPSSMEVDSVVPSSAALSSHPEKADLNTLVAFEKSKTDKPSEGSSIASPATVSSSSSRAPRLTPRGVAEDWVYDLT